MPSPLSSLATTLRSLRRRPAFSLTSVLTVG